MDRGQGISGTHAVGEVSGELPVIPPPLAFVVCLPSRLCASLCFTHTLDTRIIKTVTEGSRFAFTRSPPMTDFGIRPSHATRVILVALCALPHPFEFRLSFYIPRGHSKRACLAKKGIYRENKKTCSGRRVLRLTAKNRDGVTVSYDQNKFGRTPRQDARA